MEPTSDVTTADAVTDDPYEFAVSASVVSAPVSTSLASTVITTGADSAAKQCVDLNEFAPVQLPQAIKPVVSSTDQTSKDQGTGVKSIGSCVSRPNRAQPITALNGCLVNIASGTGSSHSVSLVRMPSGPHNQVQKATFTLQHSARNDRTASSIMAAHKTILPASATTVTTSPSLTVS